MASALASLFAVTDVEIAETVARFLPWYNSWQSDFSCYSYSRLSWRYLRSFSFLHIYSWDGIATWGDGGRIIAFYIFSVSLPSLLFPLFFLSLVLGLLFGLTSLILAMVLQKYNGLLGLFRLFVAVLLYQLQRLLPSRTLLIKLPVLLDLGHRHDPCCFSDQHILGQFVLSFLMEPQLN